MTIIYLILLSFLVNFSYKHRTNLFAPGGHVHLLRHDCLECLRKLRFRTSRLAGAGSMDHVSAK